VFGVADGAPDRQHIAATHAGGKIEVVHVLRPGALGTARMPGHRPTVGRPCRHEAVVSPHPGTPAMRCGSVPRSSPLQLITTVVP
jgi:hypothetical protein